jgi:hypothetical protein
MAQKVLAPAKSSLAFNAFLDIIAALFVLAVGTTLWSIGAYFTLLALAKFGLPINDLDAFAWLIPIGVSVLELRYWPEAKQTQVKTGMMLLVGGFDLLSTSYGIYLWFPGRIIPLGMGYTMPRTGLALFIPVLVVSIILTFGPERIIIWAGKEIQGKWSGTV